MIFALGLKRDLEEHISSLHIKKESTKSTTFAKKYQKQFFFILICIIKYLFNINTFSKFLTK